MNSCSDRIFPTNPLSEVDLHISVFISTLFEDFFSPTFCTLYLTLAVYIVFNAALIARQGMNWSPLIVVDKFHSY